MRAGLATLEVLEREHLGERAAAAGAELRGRLRQALSCFAMFKEEYRPFRATTRAAAGTKPPSRTETRPVTRT